MIKYIIYIFYGKTSLWYISIFTKRATIARILHVADAHVAISAHRIDVQASKCAHAPLIRLVHLSFTPVPDRVWNCLSQQENGKIINKIFACIEMFAVHASTFFFRPAWTAICTQHVRIS